MSPTAVERRREEEAEATTAPTAGAPEPTFGSYFVATYPPFSVWRPEGCEALARRLSGNAAGTCGKPLGLYVHLPFCARRCDYCYYLSYADGRRRRMDEYLDALRREAALYAATPALAGRPVDFLYFGGGTPSLLTVDQLGRLFDGLAASFPRSAAREVTFECAPQSVTGAKLRRLRDAGVSRLSLGVQQLDDAVLEANGRIHRVQDVERAWEAIRQRGFPIVNVDLIAGLVGESDRSFDRSLERVVAMGPESITLYPLEIPRNTPLYRSLTGGGALQRPASWEVKRRRLDRAFAALETAGYTRRSAYAAVRDPGRHPFLYQEEQYRGADLLGLGAASFSYLDGIHHQNLARLESYLEALGAGRLPFGRAYALSADERCIRELILQLKLGRLEASVFRRRFGVDVLRRFAAPLDDFERHGWVVLEGDGVRVTREGLLRIDALLPAFYLPHHRGVRYS